MRKRRSGAASRLASQKAWRSRKRQAQARAEREHHIAITGGVGNPGGATTNYALLMQIMEELRGVRRRLDEVYMQVLL